MSQISICSVRRARTLSGLLLLLTLVIGLGVYLSIFTDIRPVFNTIRYGCPLPSPFIGTEPVAVDLARLQTCPESYAHTPVEVRGFIFSGDMMEGFGCSIRTSARLYAFGTGQNMFTQPSILLHPDSGSLDPFLVQGWLRRAVCHDRADFWYIEVTKQQQIQHP